MQRKLQTQKQPTKTRQEKKVLIAITLSSTSSSAHRRIYSADIRWWVSSYGRKQFLRYPGPDIWLRNRLITEPTVLGRIQMFSTFSNGQFHQNKQFRLHSLKMDIKKKL